MEKKIVYIAKLTKTIDLPDLILYLKQYNLYNKLKKYLEITDEQKAIYSCLNLVDLAGSERLNENLENKSDLLVETGHINKSLFILTNVINKLASKNQHIPYRDSKLTRVLA